jgi:hypothetical protein
MATCTEPTPRTSESAAQLRFDERPKPQSWILWSIAVFSAVGAIFALWLRGVPAGTQDPRLWFNAFFVLFSRNEPIGLLIVAVFSVVAAVLLRTKRPAAQVLRPPLFHWITVTGIALAVFIISAIGTKLVCHNYGLSADENMADFQARIFLRGKISAEVPEQWIPVVRLIKPTYVDYFPGSHSWKSAYLPVYAAMRTVFQRVGLQSLLNPFLAAVTVVAVWGATRNIWPNRPDIAFVAAALLAASSQFLLMTMTAYSMPAHLALNSVWLWLYSSPDRRRFYAAPFVGVLAIGLHQPNVHILFVAPFVFRLLLDRRWRATTIFGIVYALGCAGWIAWRYYYLPATQAPTISYFRLLNPQMLIVQPMNLLLLIGWTSLAMPLLVVLGFSRIWRERPIVQDAALSCLLTFGFYYFFYLDQGHGWGYRYFHSALISLAVVAAAGWERLTELVGQRLANQFVLSAVILSVFIQLPIRCYQAERFVRPYALAAGTLGSLKTDLVALNPFQAWYSADLIRNDPFLEHKPIVVAVKPLSPEEARTLRAAGTTHFATPQELEQFGLATRRYQNFDFDPFLLGRGPIDWFHSH